MRVDQMLAESATEQAMNAEPEERQRRELIRDWHHLISCTIDEFDKDKQKGLDAMSDLHSLAATMMASLIGLTVQRGKEETAIELFISEIKTRTELAVSAIKGMEEGMSRKITSETVDELIKLAGKINANISPELQQKVEAIRDKLRKKENAR